MSSTFGILFELLFSGAALAFGVWQLISVRRAQWEDVQREDVQREDAQREDSQRERDAGASPS